jgi:hypothetical protein
MISEQKKCSAMYELLFGFAKNFSMAMKKGIR